MARGDKYDIQFTRSARKELQALPINTQDRVLQAIGELQADPRPSGCKKLKGVEDIYRIRVGDYRVLYEIHDEDIVIFVVRVRHRKDAYN